jgi:hypothetical protein
MSVTAWVAAFTVAFVVLGVIFILPFCRRMAPQNDEERRLDDEAQMAALREYAERKEARSEIPGRVACR